ncbi:hypothetical protein R3P38DRAFT_327848 [Favolaschia claudopus]|uniref:Uncharacterized protein n=1 Tax=Favolaschia claudopus TaxID=2862362 RepID=A0AAV9ZMW4_9AGAR
MSRFCYAPQAPTEPKLYIYYRVYGPDGAVRAKTAASLTDPYLACISTTSIPPPHKISTLKRCIVAAEGLNGLTTATRTELYLTLDSPHASNEQDEVAILQSDRPGATPETALVLVHHEELQGAEPRQMPSTISSRGTEAESSYLYYRLFTRTDRDVSKLAIYSNETSIGRVPRLMLPVPHNRTSIRRFIAQAEGRQILNASEFYENIAAQEPSTDEKYFPLISDTAFGSRDSPIVLVLPERRAGLFNRPARLISKPPEYNRRVSTLYWTGALHRRRGCG